MHSQWCTLQAAADNASGVAAEPEDDPPTEYEELDWGTSNTITHGLPSVALMVQSSEQSFSLAASSTLAAEDERTQVNIVFFCFIFYSVLLIV